MADERSQETHEFLDCGPAGCGRIHCRHDGGVDDIGIQVNPKPTRFVPHAALRDPALYELLALVDAIRDGRAREWNLAERVLVRRLKASHGES